MPADIIDYKIFGDDMQAVEIELDPGEAVRAEVGAMLYMEDGIQMQTSMGPEGGSFGSKLFAGLKRIVTGESFFITSYVNTGQSKQHVAFAAPYPGKIVPLDLKALGGEFLCQKDGFLCAAKGVDIDVAFTKKIGTGLFGGEGFILQRLKGDGLAFIHAGGTIIQRSLAAGESLRVDTGCLVAFAPTVDYDIQFVGGFKNALFGGEGLFFAKLTGPGLVYLQSLPFSRLADRIMRASYGGREEGGLGIGSLLGSDD
ncbi:MAG: TIGR00266 family protein [Candidatus Thermochlorobacter sp.]